MIEIQEFLCEILQLWDRGILTACADNSRSVDGFLQTFFEGVECLTCNKLFSCSADIEHDQDAGILQWNLYHCGIGRVWLSGQVVRTLDL